MPEPATFSRYYVFAAKGIQDFILKGDKLRLMIGASGLVEQLPNAFLDKLLSELHLQVDVDYRILSRSAGGARLLFKESAPVDALAKILPIAVDLYAPGLEVVQSIRPLTCGLKAAMSQAEQDLRIRRNCPVPVMPPPGPLVERCPRSGQPVTGYFRQQDEKEPADAAMQAKDLAVRDAKRILEYKIRNDGQSNISVPESFSSFCNREKGLIAIIHIDGNGLGLKISNLLQNGLSDEETANRYAKFSSDVEHITQSAARNALAELTKHNDSVPVVPLIVAGDDLTLIMKARDAVPFVKSYLQNMESLSRDDNPENGMTACAGIVFAKPDYPFAQAYDLCESLCSFAKNETKRSRSAVAFWRLTSSLADDFPSIREKELTTSDSILTMMPYIVNGPAQNGLHPCLDDLLELKEKACLLPRGSLRNVLSLLYESREKAAQAYDRLIEIARPGMGTGDENPAQAFISAMRKITGASLFGEGSTPKTPLHDALELIAAEKD